jgi:amino acid adenylation domain-containing protein
MDKKVIHTVFEEVVTRRSAKIAIETEGASITYGNLNIYANKLSHLLQWIGCAPGAIVNVIAPSSIQLVAAMLAVFKTDCIYLPVDLSFSEKRLRQIFNDTCDGIAIIVPEYQHTFLEMIGRYRISLKYLIVTNGHQDTKLYKMIDGAITGMPYDEKSDWSANPEIPVNGDDSNYIFYTSGSTGEAKAIVGRHVGLSHFIHWEIKEFLIDSSCRISQLTQVTFDASLRDIFIALISGGTLCIPGLTTRNDLALLLKWLQDDRISLVHCVPSFFRVLTRVLQHDPGIVKDMSALKYVLLAGEMVYMKDILNWHKLAGHQTKFVNLYGPTETTMVKTFFRIDKLSENGSQVIPAGKPISNTVLAIIKDGRICQPGEIGEIYIKTPFMTKGYYKNTQLTNEYFVQNPLVNDSKDIVYKTGDQGRFLPDGNIEVLGRLDDQVKVNGIRVELGEIERAMLEMENVTGVVVKTHRGEDGLAALVTYYTGEKRDTSDFREGLLKLLNPAIVPGYFIHMDAFPLNINGKVDKRALPLPEDVIMGGADFQQPEGELEKMLEDLWKEVLGYTKIGRNISFFSIGGHSLRAIQLISRIHKILGVNIRIADVFTNKTISELAAFINKTAAVQFSRIDPMPAQSHYPLSRSQQRLWVLCQFEEGSIAYNMPGIYVFEGSLNQAALLYAFEKLIERHEVLRTVFRNDEEGNVRQFVLPAGDVDFRIHFQDLQDQSELDQKLAAAVRKELLKHFDLAKGPLLRAGLLQIADNRWIFLQTIHHIISDGWSMNILIRELLLYYNAFIKSKESELPPLRIQYKDYAAWQQQQLNTETYNAHRCWWLQQFSGELPVLQLPADRVRPAVKTYNGDVVHKSINKDLLHALKMRVSEYGGTLFMGLLAAVNALLYRYTGQEDIIIGSPTAGREHIDLEDQLGFYANTVAFRTRFKGNNSFEELLAIVKQVTVGAYEHQSYPFDELVEELQLQRDMSRNALFDVSVALHNTQVNAIAEGQHLENLSISNYKEAEHLFCKFDVIFNFVEHADGLYTGIEFNRDIYNKSTIERLAGHFEQLLTSIIQDITTPIYKINYLTTPEQAQVLFEFNDTAVAYPENKTVIDLFEEQTAKTPDAVAVVFKETQLTYAALNNRANLLAAYLSEHYSITPGDIVSIRLQRSEWLIVAILGILKCRAAYMPIDPDYPADRIDFMIADSKSKLLINDKVLGEIKEGLKAGVIGLLPATQVNELAYVIYTSGSTGEPKGCLITNGNLFNYVQWANLYYFKKTPIVNFGLFTSLSFDLTVTSIFCSLTTGGQLFIYDQYQEVSAILSHYFSSESGLNAIKLTPSHINMLEHLGIIASTVSHAIVGGEEVTGKHVTILKNINPGIKVFNEYGPTETTVGCIVKELDEKAPVLIGKPVGNTNIYILDQYNELCGIGIDGEICVGGAGVGPGYLNRDALTTEKFVANPFRQSGNLYRTGDAGKWLANGEIAFLGRKDDEVKIRGYRIIPGEIEAVLLIHPSIESVAVVAHTDHNYEKELVCWFTGRESLSKATLRRYLHSYLPLHMIPTRFVQLEHMPLNTNGKIDRKLLLTQAGKELPVETTYTAPRNETEEKLVLIWQELLSKSQIGIEDNFFEAGGNSIRIVRLAKMINESLDASVSVALLFQYPSIKDLVDYLLQEQTVQEVEQYDRDELIEDLNKFI